MGDPKKALQQELKEAIKNREPFRRDTIRLAQSAIKQIEVDSRKELSPDEVVAVIQREVKKRYDSVEELIRYGRGDAAEKERREIAILEEFLPQQLAREEIEILVKEIIARLGATSQKDMGKVMAVLMPEVKGRADGRLVNQIVREHLS